MQISLADYLKCTISDVQKMSLIEFKTWLAYFQVKQAEEKRESKKHGNQRANNPRRHR